MPNCVSFIDKGGLRGFIDKCDKELHFYNFDVNLLIVHCSYCISTEALALYFCANVHSLLYNIQAPPTLISLLKYACRNFPQGTIKDMVKDASQGISFVCNNISEYGGDPDR